MIGLIIILIYVIYKVVKRIGEKMNEMYKLWRNYYTKRR